MRLTERMPLGKGLMDICTMHYGWHFDLTTILEGKLEINYIQHLGSHLTKSVVKLVYNIFGSQRWNFNIQWKPKGKKIYF